MKAWTESQVADKLARRFKSPEWAFMRQVRRGTGFKHNNTADAIAASTWPSRGLFLVGFEIKCGRGDWIKELRHPGKSDEIQKYCQHWYVATPAKFKIIEAGEIPATWGHVEVSGRGCKIIREAPHLKAAAPDMFLLASILRNVFNATVPADDVADMVNSEVEMHMKQTHDTAANELEALRRKIGVFEKSSGVSIGASWEAEMIGDAVKFVVGQKQGGFVESAQRMRNEHRRAMEGLDTMLAAFDASSLKIEGGKIVG